VRAHKTGWHDASKLMSALLPKRRNSGGPIMDTGVAGRWADRLIYLKIVSETRAQPTFGRQRYVQTSGR
jgi:hypothetical protein